MKESKSQMIVTSRGRRFIHRNSTPSSHGWIKDCSSSRSLGWCTLLIQALFVLNLCFYFIFYAKILTQRLDVLSEQDLKVKRFKVIQKRLVPFIFPLSLNGAVAAFVVILRWMFKWFDVHQTLVISVPGSYCLSFYTSSPFQTFCHDALLIRCLIYSL